MSNVVPISGESLVFPPAALALHTGIVGKTGSGKTSTGKLIVEQLVEAGARVCVLDPIKSDWWGVVSSADGKRAGLEFAILGGPMAHVPLHSGAGAAIAELVANGKLPLAVLDMAEFEPGGQQRFFSDFVPRLIQKMCGSMYLVLEEAHLFAPKERGAPGGHENMSIHWAKTLATAGRSKGIRLIVATQRTQSLHNAVLGSCDTLIAHRLTAPADQEPVIKWLKANTAKDVAVEVARSLAGLKTGTGWLCSSEAGIFERRAFPRIKTFDNSATPTEDMATRNVNGGNIDMGALRDLIGEAVAVAEANDPAKLKARVRELEGKLSLATRQLVVDDKQWNREELQGIATKLRGERDHFRKELAYLTEWAHSVLPVLRHAREAPAPGPDPKFLHTVAEFAETPVINTVKPRTFDLRAESRKAFEAAAKQRIVDVSDGPGLTRPQQRILDSLAWWFAVGVDAPEDAAVAAMAKYAPGGGSYKNRKGELRAMGYIEYPRDGTIRLTEKGLDWVVVPGITRTEDLHKAVLGRLTNPQCRILEPLLRAYPDALTDAELGEASGYEVGGGSYKNRKGELRSFGLIDYPRAGVIIARDILFPRP